MNYLPMPNAEKGRGQKIQKVCGRHIWMVPKEICNAWRLAAMVGLVPRQCLNVGLQVRFTNLPRKAEIFDLSTRHNMSDMSNP